jgi:transcriptional regulator with XRE-family HTH domain
MNQLDLAQEIGKRLRAARKAAGYRSATALSAAKHIPMSTYSQHESGKRALNADTLFYYGDLFGISAGWLLTGEGEPYAAHIENADTKTSILSEELFDVANPGQLKMMEQTLQPITSRIAHVDMKLFSEVCLRIAPLFAVHHSALDQRELWDFAIEVYNGIISTSASDQDRLAMIDLSVASLKRGAVKKSLGKTA